MEANSPVVTTVDCDRWTSRKPVVDSVTTQEQHGVEERCLRLYTQHMRPGSSAIMREGVTLERAKHVAYLRNGLRELSSGYQALDASRPWLCYWILHALDLLGDRLEPELASSVVAFLRSCQDPEGGYCGGPYPGQLPHLAPTYAAINALVIIGTREAYESIDRKALHRFLLRRRGSEPGSYTMHDDGEVDVRGAYTAVAVANLTNVLSKEVASGVAEWIASCQTYEGGLGGEPGLEAHGGYTFCGVAALSILGRADVVRQRPLLRWLASCQKGLEGGFHGRTNKLVDGCYSFWQGGALAVLGGDPSGALAVPSGPEGSLLADMVAADGAWLFDQSALQDYLMVCGQVSRGGMRDKPGKEADFYHTCYCLSGMAVAQHSSPGQGGDESRVHSPYGTEALLPRVDTRHNIRAEMVDQARAFFEAQGSLAE